MQINLKEPFGVLKHSASTEDVAHLLSLFIKKDSLLLFSFYERNLPLVDNDIQEFINERRLYTNSNGYCRGKRQFLTGTNQIIHHQILFGSQ